MKLSKIILPSMLIAGALAVGSIGVNFASAEELKNYPPIVVKLAEKFNLDKDDVWEVFEEEHANRETEMLSRFEDRLNAGVANGKLTEAQKESILDKHEEIRAMMDELRDQDLTNEEKRSKMQSLHSELKEWASNEGIDLSFIGPFGKGFKMGKRIGGWEEKLAE